MSRKEVKCLQEELKPIDDFTVWLKIRQHLKDKYADTDFRLKEDEEDHIRVIFDNGKYNHDPDFEKNVTEIIAFYLGPEVLERIEFLYDEEDGFKIIY